MHTVCKLQAKRSRSLPWTWNRLKPSSKIFLLTVPRRCFFFGSFMLLMSCICYDFVRVCLLMFVVTCWEQADLLAFVCDVELWSCHFPIGILGQVWCLIVSIPDLCLLLGVKDYGQIYVQSVTNSSLNFDRGCLYLAKVLLMVCKLQRRLHIIAMFLGSQAKVKFTLNLFKSSWHKLLL